LQWSRESSPVVALAATGVAPKARIAMYDMSMDTSGYVLLQQQQGTHALGEGVSAKVAFMPGTA
jgi:hypothetical protein